MSQPLYIRRDNQIKGPFPPGQISQSLLIGRFRLSDEVSVDKQDWTPIQIHPELIPDVLKGDPDDPEVRERLQAARRWADERRPAHEAPDSDKRKPETTATIEYRKNRESNYQQLRKRKDVAVIQVVVVILAVAVLMFLGFSYMPKSSVSDAQCDKPAAPGIDWRSCRMPGLKAIKRDLSGAKLNSTILSGANLFGSNFTNANLDYADLSIANLSFANFRNATLKGTNLQHADLTQADFSHANLAYANLSSAKMKGTILKDAILDNAIWTDGQVCLPGSVGGCRLQK